MTSFEFVFGLISVITSLALTQLLAGCVALLRHADRVRLSWRHACWTAVAFMVLVGNWASFWGLRDLQVWRPLDVLIPLVFIGVLYAFCNLVLPERPADGAMVDLRDYHAQQGRRYVWVQLVFALLATLVIARGTSTFWQWLDAARFALLAALCSAIALRARSRWLDTLAATALLVLASVFMWTRLLRLSI